MSDELDLAAESALDEQGSSPEAPDAPAPWGDDFNAERAWKTITHLRGREKELESKAKQFDRLTTDEDARRELLSQWGYEFEDDDNDDDDLHDETPQRDPSVARLEQQLQQLQQRQALREFEEDLDKAASEVNVTLTARERRFVHAESIANGFNPKATRQAIKEVLEDRQALESQFLENYRGSKRAPHISSSGKSASQKTNLDDANARAAYIDELLGAVEE